MEELYNVWARRDAYFETHFEKTLLQLFTEYGGGSTESMINKGKIFSAGYELYIVAFFIGLYSNRKQKLNQPTKKFGQPIQYWGNLDSKKGRKAYPKLREYIFIALIARTEIDLLGLEKGEISANDVAKMLSNTMDQYANYGFHLIEDKHRNNPSYFFNHTSFLNEILSFLNLPSDENNSEIEEL